MPKKRSKKVPGKVPVDQLEIKKVEEAVELAFALGTWEGGSNVPSLFHALFSRMTLTLGHPSMRLRFWRGKECVSLSCSVDCLGVGLGAVPKAVYRQAELGKDVKCVPIHVNYDRTLLTIDYKVPGDPGPYFGGDKHLDGTKCVTDLKSITIHWEVKTETHFNKFVEGWSKCLGEGERAGLEDTLLDDNVLVTVATAKPRKPDGTLRAMRRHLIDATVLVDGHRTLTITYGQFLDTTTARAPYKPFADFVAKMCPSTKARMSSAWPATKQAVWSVDDVMMFDPAEAPSFISSSASKFEDADFMRQLTIDMLFMADPHSHPLPEQVRADHCDVSQTEQGAC